MIALSTRLLLATAAIACAATNVAAQRLIVVSSGDTPGYQHALSGIRKLAPGAETLTLVGDRDEKLEAALMRSGRDTAIVALGTRATDLVARVAPTGPAISCMAAGDSGTSMTMPVVPLAVPLDVHLPWLKRLLPEARTIAVLYDPAQNARYAAELVQGLARAGYVPMSEPVPSPAALPRALERIAEADALLAIPDTTVYSPETAKGLLLFTFRTRTPMVAFSDAWVQKGALYGLEWDYAELGAYCAALAQRLVAHGKPPSVAPPTPPRPRVSVNLRAATQQKLKWDAAGLADVDKKHE